MLTRFALPFRRLTRLAVLLLVGSAASSVAAQRSATPALDPRKDISPSGAYSLQVEPTSPAGRGAAHYRLEHDGAEVWSAELPYTLWESVVGDDGTVAGYAYGNGLEGYSGVRGDHGDGDFRVVILDPAGAPRLNLSTERTSSRFMHQHPVPEAAGLLLDPDSDRLLVRIRDEDLNRQLESWWPFRLSTGQELPKFCPKLGLSHPGPLRFIVGARHVRQTPLSLVHWWTFDTGDNSGSQTKGARFMLLDPDGVPVWTLDLPADYMVPGDEEAEDRLWDGIRRNGAILQCTEPRRFELGLVRDGQRVLFEATPEGTAPQHWRVVEVGREDWSRAPPPATSEAVAEGRLEQVGTFELGGPSAQATSFGDIRHFSSDDRGRLGLLRRSESGELSFLLVSPEGVVLDDVPIDLGAADADHTLGGIGSEGAGHALQAEWIAKDRWLLSVAWPGGGNENPAWWFDLESKRVEPIAHVRIPQIKSIAADGRGGFVALWIRQQNFSIEDTIEAFDSSGQSRWTLVGNSGDETRALSPEAVAVTPDGHIGVLDNTRQLILVYEPDGSHAATIDLRQSWGEAPNYPVDLAADASGGWIVRDFNGRVPLVRMSASGAVTARLDPAFPDGRRLDPIGRVAAAADGGLWTTDGYALLHLNEQGVVDRVAGSAPDPERIDSIAAVCSDPRGRLFVGDARTGAVHVFDAQGSRLFVCKPAPEDDGSCRQISVAADGRIFVGGGQGFVCFSPIGVRTGTTPRILHPAGESRNASDEQWLFQPKGGHRWVRDFSGIALADADGHVVRRIEKRSDGTWLGIPGAASMAPDGSLAVISESLCLYDAGGEALQTIAMPTGTDYACMAFDGKRVLLANKEALFVRDLLKGTWKRYPFEGQTGGFRAIFPAPDGKRLRLVPAQSMQVLDFRLLD